MAKDLGGGAPDPAAINTWEIPLPSTPGPSSPDPATINTRAEFTTALRAIKGKRSYAQLTESAYKLITKIGTLTEKEKPAWTPQTLERGTVSGWLSHGRCSLPVRDRLITFLVVCEVPRTAIPAWLNALDRVTNDPAANFESSEIPRGSPNFVARRSSANLIHPKMYLSRRVALIGISGVLIVGAILVILYSILTRNGSLPSGATPESPHSVDKTVVIDAMVPWNDTGVDIDVESEVEMSAEGVVYIAASDNGKTPEGSAGCIGTADRRATPGPHLVPGLTCLALVGRIGNSQPFEVGRSTRFLAPASGRLFLGVNDNAFGDNSGSWSVRLTVNPG